MKHDETPTVGARARRWLAGSMVALLGLSLLATVLAPGASSQTIPITITQLASSENPSTAGRPVTFGATVVGLFSTPSGDVRFLADGAPLGTSSLDGSGHANLSTAALAPGDHTVTAEYLGDGVHSPSAGSVAQAVHSGPPAPAPAPNPPPVAAPAAKTSPKASPRSSPTPKASPTAKPSPSASRKPSPRAMPAVTATASPAPRPQPSPSQDLLAGAVSTTDTPAPPAAPLDSLAGPLAPESASSNGPLSLITLMALLAVAGGCIAVPRLRRRRPT